MESVHEVARAHGGLAAVLAVLPVAPRPHLALVAHRHAVVVAGGDFDDPDAVVAQRGQQDRAAVGLRRIDRMLLQPPWNLGIFFVARVQPKPRPCLCGARS